MRLGTHLTLVIVLCKFWLVVEVIGNTEMYNLMSTFLGEKKWAAAMFFNCWNVSAQIQHNKMWSFNEVHLMMYSLDKNIFPSLFMTKYHPLAVILDVNCNGSDHLLFKASQEMWFSRLHHWLLLSVSAKPLSSSDIPLTTNLESLYLPLDSHITIAHAVSTTGNIQVQNVYRTAKNQPLTVTSPRKWISGHSVSSGSRRDNYGGITLRTSVLVIDGTWEQYMDINYRHLNSEAKLHYVFMSYISEMLNFRMNVTITDTWGYPTNGSGCFNGIIGTLQESCGDSEITTTGLMWKTERLAVIDYVTETIQFRPAFVFLKPSLSEVSIIYELPFSKSVWTTYTLTVIILTIILVYLQRIEKKIRLSTTSTDNPISWSDAVLDTIGIICQQGTGNVPKYLSSRIIFIFLLLLSLFLITSYSAIIVSLIQTSSSAINTLSDLMKSPLKLSMVDALVNETTDPAVEKVFKEKLYTQPFHEAFTSEEVGMNKVRRGLHAFHGLFGIYKIISDTYEEHEKCRLKEIKMFLANHVGFPIRKSSPYIEHIKQRIHWLREVGILGREEKRWYYSKPKCESGGQNFVSVGIQDFYPTLVILTFGIVLATGILLLETACSRYQHIFM